MALYYWDFNTGTVVTPVISISDDKATMQNCSYGSFIGDPIQQGGCSLNIISIPWTINKKPLLKNIFYFNKVFFNMKDSVTSTPINIDGKDFLPIQTRMICGITSSDESFNSNNPAICLNRYDLLFSTMPIIYSQFFSYESNKNLLDIDLYFYNAQKLQFLTFALLQIPSSPYLNAFWASITAKYSNLAPIFFNPGYNGGTSLHEFIFTFDLI